MVQTPLFWFTAVFVPIVVNLTSDYVQAVLRRGYENASFEIGTWFDESLGPSSALRGRAQPGMETEVAQLRRKWWAAQTAFFLGSSSLILVLGALLALSFKNPNTTVTLLQTAGFVGWLVALVALRETASSLSYRIRSRVR